MSAKRCGTCRFGKFEMTSHATPRPKNQAGVCLWQPSGPILVPSCVKVSMFRSYTWPRDGTECPTWEGKESK